MFLGLPWQWWAIVAPAPAGLLAARAITWTLLRRRNARPGYLDLTRRS